jgi:hypothetical protein
LLAVYGVDTVYTMAAPCTPPAPDPDVPGSPDAHLPKPPSERGAWLFACVVGGLGVAGLVAVLTGMVGQTVSVAPARPPVVLLVAATPTPGPAASASALAGAGAGGGSRARRARSDRHSRAAIVARPSAAQQDLQARRFVDQTQAHISTRWMEGFYPIYAVAQSTFGVNWLLVASIHMQESAFSTAPSTYHGLNFAGCCGGPMQFNVTNGPVSTWQRVSDSYIYGRRPASYDHMTAAHPSIYDDFDAVMAAAHLLSADGAEFALDGAAWDAAYAYYGHDPTGVAYADTVLARAIGWSQHGFCVNCGVEQAMVEAVHAAYGAPVLAALTMATTASVHRAASRSKR